MRAWFLGDFEGCLALCDRVRAHDVDMVSQLALLRARALLRLARNDEAIGVVCDAFVAHGTLDASLTARMLLGTGYVRRGEYRRGLDLLVDAYAASENAHPTIRSEIALNVALAHYSMRELAEADNALDLVSPDADIVHARSFEYRGWVALRRGDYSVAVASFRAAVERLDVCRHYDRFLEGHALHALSILAAERLDRTAWLFVEHRSEKFPWSSAGLELPRHTVRIHASMMYEADGRIHDALRLVGDAEKAAPTPALRLEAQCRRAAILRAAKEPFAHHDAVRRLREELEQIDFATLRGDDLQLPLAVAEETAYAGDALGARALLKRYDELSDVSADLWSLTGDVRLTGVRAFVEAVIADAGGEQRLAHARFRDAFQTFHRIGYERRALLAALRLGELTGQAYLFEYVDRTVRKLAPGSALRARARRQNPTPADPILSDLSRTERAVLELVCDGKSTMEIAAVRGRSKQTIRNTISKILTAFGVPDRPALLRECLRRGLIAR
jgi:DNA-binding CsgD family transcriptional regulator/tetratricopeptide (TPR) repeat protein